MFCRLNEITQNYAKVQQKCSKLQQKCSKSAAKKRRCPPLAIDIQEGIVTARKFYIFLLSVPGVNRKILCTFAAPKYFSSLMADKSIFALLHGGGSGNAHMVTEMTKDT